MNALRIRRAETTVDSLTVGQEQKHTAHWVRTVRDDELLADEQRDLLTAYAWHLERQEPEPRSSRPVLSLLTDVARAEEDAFVLGVDAFVQRHDFRPQDLTFFRRRAIVAGQALLEVLP